MNKKSTSTISSLHPKPGGLGWFSYFKTMPSVVLALLVLFSSVVAVQAGAATVGFHDWLSFFGISNSQSTSAGLYVLQDLRLPRVFFSLLVGAGMGLAGALTQGLFRNPLADPGLLGVSAGGACAVAVMLVFLGKFEGQAAVTWGLWLTPLCAFIGSLAVCFALDAAAKWLTPGSIAGLLLTGVALNALAAAVIGLCTYLASDAQLRSLSFWTLGSLSGANWTLVAILAVLLVLVGWRAHIQADAFNALALGQTAAAHLGVDVARLRTRVIIWVAILAGFSVAWCGMISFIGLMAPNLVRLWAGPDMRRVLPLSMLMGAGLLLVADTLARTVAIPAEIPVGVFTALLGAPLFLLLLRQRNTY